MAYGRTKKTSGLKHKSFRKLSFSGGLKIGKLTRNIEIWLSITVSQQIKYNIVGEARKFERRESIAAY